MKIYSLSFLTLLIGILTTGCFRNDTRIGEYHVPNMTNEECLNILSNRLRSVEGVTNVEADYEAKKVWVTFDGLKAGLKNIEFYIAGAGFDVNDVQAPDDAKASLPESCR